MLLIMKIANQIVVDGCHNYKTHLFGINTRIAPKLFQAEYDCEDIRLRAPRSRAHLSVDSWMDWVGVTLDALCIRSQRYCCHPHG